MSWEPWGNCGAAAVGVSGGPWLKHQGRCDWQVSACGSGGRGWSRHLGPWGLLSNLRLREGLEQTEHVGLPEPLRWFVS